MHTIIYRNHWFLAGLLLAATLSVPGNTWATDQDSKTSPAERELKSAQRDKELSDYYRGRASELLDQVRAAETLSDLRVAKAAIERFQNNELNVLSEKHSAEATALLKVASEEILKKETAARRLEDTEKRVRALEQQCPGCGSKAREELQDKGLSDLEKLNSSLKLLEDALAKAEKQKDLSSENLTYFRKKLQEAEEEEILEVSGEICTFIGNRDNRKGYRGKKESFQNLVASGLRKYAKSVSTGDEEIGISEISAFISDNEKCVGDSRDVKYAIKELFDRMAKNASQDDLEEVRDALTEFGEEFPEYGEFLAPTFHNIAKRYMDQGRTLEHYELARMTISQAEQLNLSWASKMRLGNYQRDLATGHGVLVAEQGMYGNPMFGQVYYSLMRGLNYDNSRYCAAGRGGMEACSNVRANLERAQEIPNIARKADEQRYQSGNFPDSGYGFDPNRTPSGMNPPTTDFTQDSLLPGASGFYRTID